MPFVSVRGTGSRKLGTKGHPSHTHLRPSRHARTLALSCAVADTLSQWPRY